MNTVQLSYAQALVVLAALAQEAKHLHPEDRVDVYAIHDHIRIQCSALVQKSVKPLTEVA